MSFRDLYDTHAAAPPPPDARATEVHLVDVRRQLEAINRARESRGAERVRSVAFLKSELRQSLQVCPCSCSHLSHPVQGMSHDTARSAHQIL